MIAGIKSLSVNRVDQVYVTDFEDVRIYTLPQRQDSHTSLPWYYMDAGVPVHLH